MSRKKLMLYGTARVRQHMLLAALAAAMIVSIGAFAVSKANAKSPGSQYCFHGYCHRVGTLAQTQSLVGWRGYLLTSYYDSCHRDRLNPCGLTSSGAVFRPDRPDNAASPLLPDGTVILAYYPKNGRATVLRITNAGPYSGKRNLDVSRATADKLGFRKKGVTSLVFEVLQAPTKAEANYVRRRVYRKVPGYIGSFETFDAALEVAKDRLGISKDNDEASGEVQVAAAVPRPQPAISPTLARKMVMLRVNPKPVKRLAPLLQGPRLVSRDNSEAADTPKETNRALEFASGFRRYFQDQSEVAFGDW